MLFKKYLLPVCLCLIILNPQNLNGLPHVRKASFDKSDIIIATVMVSSVIAGAYVLKRNNTEKDMQAFIKIVNELNEQDLKLVEKYSKIENVEGKPLIEMLSDMDFFHLLQSYSRKHKYNNYRTLIKRETLGNKYFRHQYMYAYPKFDYLLYQEASRRININATYYLEKIKDEIEEARNRIAEDSFLENQSLSYSWFLQHFALGEVRRNGKIELIRFRLRQYLPSKYNSFIPRSFGALPDRFVPAKYEPLFRKLIKRGSPVTYFAAPSNLYQDFLDSQAYQSSCDEFFKYHLDRGELSFIEDYHMLPQL